MRVLCRHGHFAFYPRNASQIGQFANYFRVTMKRERDYFTFAGLYGAKDYSLIGKPYLNLPALTTYAGNPWDVMRENNYVYSIGLGILVPKASIVALVELPLVGFYFLAPGALVQPGSRNRLGNQLMSYSAEFVDEGLALRVLEFEYE